MLSLSAYSFAIRSVILLAQNYHLGYLLSFLRYLLSHFFYWETASRWLFLVVCKRSLTIFTRSNSISSPAQSKISQYCLASKPPPIDVFTGPYFLLSFFSSQGSATFGLCWLSLAKADEAALFRPTLPHPSSCCHLIRTHKDKHASSHICIHICIPLCISVTETGQEQSK